MRVIFLPLMLLWVLFSLLYTVSSAQTIRFQRDELSKHYRYGYVDYYQDHVIRFQKGVDKNYFQCLVLNDHEYQLGRVSMRVCLLMAREEFKIPLDLFSDVAYFFLFTHVSIKEEDIVMLEAELFPPSFLMMMGIRGRVTGILEDPFLALPTMTLMSIEEEDYHPYFWPNIANEIEGY